MLPSDQWDECPAGTLSRMVAERSKRKRRALLDGTVRGSVGLLVVIGGLVTMSILLSQATSDAAMTCEQAAQLFALYHDETLESDSHQQVETHLRECPHCREAYRQLYAQEARSPAKRLPELMGAVLTGH